MYLHSITFILQAGLSSVYNVLLYSIAELFSNEKVASQPNLSVEGGIFPPINAV